MHSSHDRVKAALADLKQGKMILLTDDPERENEGDLIVAAEKITPEIMNFMIRQGTGIVCFAGKAEQLKKLGLPPMVSSQDNTSTRGTSFSISVDAKESGSGVSAADRTRTIQVMMDDHTSPDDLVKPGHIFPLQAKAGGVLERQGHTEGAVDLVYLAGLKPAAVLCEVMNPDGTMTCGAQLEAFAETHQLTILSINDLITYRLGHENLIEEEISTTLPLEHYGLFNITVMKEKITGHEHIVLSKEKQNPTHSTFVHIHSACIIGDLFASERCNCYAELHHALKWMSKEGGLLIYLHPGSMSLFNSIKAHALQDQRLNKDEASEKLGAYRNDAIAAAILRHLKINNVRLLTNNPQKIADLKKYGIQAT